MNGLGVTIIPRQGGSEFLHGDGKLVADREGRYLQDFGHLFIAHAIFFHHLEDEAGAGRQQANGLLYFLNDFGRDTELFGVADMHNRLYVYFIEQYNRILKIAGDIIETEVFGHGIEIYLEVVDFGQLVPYLPELYKYIGNDFIGRLIRLDERKAEAFQSGGQQLIQSLVGFEIFIQGNPLLQFFNICQLMRQWW